MNDIKPLDRVRLEDDLKPSEQRDGTGTVLSIINGVEARVHWDGTERMLHNGVKVEVLTVVPVSCDYTDAQWKPGRKWGITGMVVLCNTHKAPASGAVYEVDPGKEGTVKEWCQGVIQP